MITRRLQAHLLFAAWPAGAAAPMQLVTCVENQPETQQHLEAAPRMSLLLLLLLALLPAATLLMGQMQEAADWIAPAEKGYTSRISRFAGRFGVDTQVRRK
jgi:hypothetical protein